MMMQYILLKNQLKLIQIMQMPTTTLVLYLELLENLMNRLIVTSEQLK